MCGGVERRVVSYVWWSGVSGTLIMHAERDECLLRVHDSWEARS